MAVKKRYGNALGRGLDALISTDDVRPQGSSTINEIPLEQIEANPNQPRRAAPDRSQQISDNCRRTPLAGITDGRAKGHTCIHPHHQ